MALLVGKDKHELFSFSIIDSASGAISEHSVDLSEAISPELETGKASARPLLTWPI